MSYFIKQVQATHTTFSTFKNMETLNRKKELIIWIILLIPFAAAAFMWPSMPDQVATHFDFNGHPDDYSNKAFALLILPGVNIFLYVLMYFIPKIDPRKNNFDQFGSSYQNIRLMTHVFMVCMFFFINQTAMNGGSMNLRPFGAGLFLFFAFLGNYMRTVKSNFFVGIRTPWTLSNDEVWRTTHQMGGRLWFYTGLVMAGLCFIIPEMVIPFAMIIVLLVITIWPVVFSYREYHRLSKEAKLSNPS